MTEPDPLDAHHWAQAMADAREPMPDPLTPEELFAQHEQMFGGDSWSGTADEALYGMISALRDMIASRDAETNRYLGVLTRHDNELTLLRARVRALEAGR